jgi:gamma-glutamyl:cysteine ligase YbdK (ATP-grasp superfamily)
MGQRVDDSALVDEHAELVRERLDRSVMALRKMVELGWFSDHEDTLGLEVELDLVDPLGRARMVNDPVLAKLGRDDIQDELARFNIELNLAPRQLSGSVFDEIARELREILVRCAARTEVLGARIVAIGTLPTLRPDELTDDQLSSNPRYALLDRRMHQARSALVTVQIDGREPLAFSVDSVAPEASATSLQLHLRVSVDRFAAYFNAAQVIAPVQVAIGANSPYVLGHELWHETRIALCEQLLDTRRADEVVVGARPRVSLGDRWVTDPIDLFSDIVETIPPLLPALGPDDPLEILASGQAPDLHELRLHNGTVWRWNRPVYDVQGGRPHLRIENRVLPSGPTVVDMVANAALYYGLVRTLADSDPPSWSGLRLSDTEADLRAAARWGLAADVRWADRRLPVRDLLLDRLLPMAAAGLDAWGVDASERDRYLGVIERRALTGVTGAVWQMTFVGHLERDRVRDRPSALREMVRRYVENMREGAPVHEWPMR